MEVFFRPGRCLARFCTLYSPVTVLVPVYTRRDGFDICVLHPREPLKACESAQ
ncbi:hypothetical protein [Pseudomonas yamanorum]|uniref:hypothetical protein n=1 Tax=Pseudomonas yamanorum TaxID=515393 RepID=UPI003F7508A9